MCLCFLVQEEKDRQLAKVKEHVIRVRYEKTLTMTADMPTSPEEAGMIALKRCVSCNI